MRTTPEIAELFKPLEHCITSEQFSPTLLKQFNADTLRNVIIYIASKAWRSKYFRPN